MRAIEFKTIIKNNRIEIPKDIQAELQIKDKVKVRVMILFDDSEDPDEKIYETKEQVLDIVNDELDSINNGLKDFEEGRIHSNETARKIYGKYL